MSHAAKQSALNLEAVTLGPFSTNCYILWREGAASCWVVDASFQSEVLVERVRALGLTPVMLVLTHAHVDHIAGVDTVRRNWPGIPVAIHEAERQWLTDANLNLSQIFGLPVTTSPAEIELHDGDVITLEGLPFQVLHTPGHSPGGIGLYQQESGLLIAGDTLFYDSIGRHDFPGSHGPTLLRSIRQKLLTLPDATRVYPGHGPETTIGRERAENPFIQ